MTFPPEAPKLLTGTTVIEVSSFVAAPLCGLTLCQLGAEVIRIDPPGGAADQRRWPLAKSGTSLYWTGLNRGKKSMTIDMRSREGQKLVQRLVTDGDGLVVTNSPDRGWLSYDTLSLSRDDVIHVHMVGRADGSTGVDYTVNAAVGFPLVTGPSSAHGPINHVLPAWDVICGLHGALAVVAALRQREREGTGARVSIALEDVALATAGNLGFLTEPQVNHLERERLGNAIFGQYGQDFCCRDGVRIMVVALTARQFHDLVNATGAAEAVTALERSLDVNFDDEGHRYRYRDVLSALFGIWFSERTGTQVEQALINTSVLFERFRTFGQVVKDSRVTENSLFAPLDQEGVGEYLAPGMPTLFDGVHPNTGTAPTLGRDTVEILKGRLNLSNEAIDELSVAGVISTN
ncbi:CoA transferase [Mycobacterium sp. 236(2023)]|uniref:CoA transferase n=1 Tax=Mycobacterium sp. 236(2023) TaxID=3038163 RepID=UPI002415040B|nr:CoA transferase [Mycobacterium sp. 236(2023)]MDG4668056.1 CoA transferase [Mycobacterium sp. 236(2023)]